MCIVPGGTNTNAPPDAKPKRWQPYISKMDTDNKGEFLIKGFNGHFHLKVIDVFGYPETTSHWGGYDTKSQIEIISSNYYVKSEFYISTGELYDFAQQLKASFHTLKGEAKLSSGEGNLKATVTFDGLGHVSLNGYYREKLMTMTELIFEFESDQTYLSQTLIALDNIVSTYGDKLGVK